MKSTAFIFFLSLLCCACTETPADQKGENICRYAATASCSNTVLSAAYLFKNEIVELRLNNELIFRYTADSAEHLTKAFCLPKDFYSVLQLRTIDAGRIRIDTTIEGYANGAAYHLYISQPQPLDWKPYYQKGGGPVRRSYLPIDSCIRFVSLVLDSMY